MALEVISIEFDNAHEEKAILLYNFLKKSSQFPFHSFSDFLQFKREELKLEPRWDFIIQRQGISIGVLSIVNTYQKPEPVFFLQIHIDEAYLTNKVNALIKLWFIQQQSIHGFEQIIAYEALQHLEQFYLSLGGRTVNWLSFFELNVNDIDNKLLTSWDNKQLLLEHNLQLTYFNEIPDNLMAEHAALHTQLSNDIKRMDYSWRVLKSQEYIRNSQKLLFLHGRKVEIGYLLNKDNAMVGMTKVVLDPLTPNLASQTITGVLQSLRGLGLAKLLKANMIRRIIEKYPEVEKIETDCLKGNDPMLLINKKLGFRRKRSRVEKEIIIDELFLPKN